MTLVFEMPLPANMNTSKLRGAHWGTGASLKNKYWAMLDRLVTVRRLPRAPKERWACAAGTCEMRTCPVMDQDNANRRMKWVWDWLQSRGYIVNDRNVRCVVTPVASTRKEQGLTLTLQEEYEHSV